MPPKKKRNVVVVAEKGSPLRVIPMLGVISFVVFGVFLVVKKTGWWAWIFIAVGAIGIIYLLTDLIPAATELNALRRIKNFKGKAVSVDDDFEKFEKAQKENKSGKSKDKDSKSVKETDTVKEESVEIPKEYEVEDTYEIKTLNTKKKNKKK